MIVAQILAVILFLLMFGLIVSEKIERHYISMGCGLLMLVVVFGLCMHDGSAIWETLSLESFITPSFWYLSGASENPSTGINWATILFVAGMMLMVESMGRAGFFRWLCLFIAKKVHYKTIPIFITFMVMSFILAMFIDSITVIMFLAAVTAELARLLRFDPIPLILSEIFCANLGGSATMCGDPPNIIVGTTLGYTFFDFVTNTGLIAVISLIFVVIYFYFCFRKDLKMRPEDAENLTCPEPGEAIRSKKEFAVSCVIFGAAVLLLVTHAQTGLTVATIGVGIGLVSLLTAGREAGKMLRQVDYKTLLFFIGLFIVVGGLEKTGILGLIANFIAAVSGDNLVVMVAIVLWISAIASAFVDNIPFAATMIPVIQSLAETQGVSLPILAWALALGTDIGGSATPIGASANVVGLSIAAKNGHLVGWGRYCKYAVPATVLVVAISMVCIVLRYCI